MTHDTELPDSVSKDTIPSDLGTSPTEPEVSSVAPKVAQHGIWQFKFIYGVHDPVLWIALFLSIPGLASFGMLGTLLTLVLSLVVLALIRWPIAALTRSSRLSGRRPRNVADHEWLPDPARLGTNRLWTGTAWSNQVSGPPPVPSVNKRVIIAATCGGLLALMTASMFFSSMNRGPATSLSASPQLATIRASISTVDANQRAYNSALDAAVANPTGANQTAVVAALSGLKGSMQTVQLQVAALSPEVPLDMRSKLNTYVSTGNAAVAVEGEIIHGSLACAKESNQAAAQACIAALDGNTSARERQALGAWRDSILALGYRVS